MANNTLRFLLTLLIPAYAVNCSLSFNPPHLPSLWEGISCQHPLTSRIMLSGQSQKVLFAQSNCRMCLMATSEPIGQQSKAFSFNLACALEKEKYNIYGKYLIGLNHAPAWRNLIMSNRYSKVEQPRYCTTRGKNHFGKVWLCITDRSYMVRSFSIL